MKVLFLLALCMLHVESILCHICCCNIVQSIFGFVEAENRTIFKIYYPFSFDICLVSTFGDADLYISDRNPTPSYDLDSYLLHSATCGEDSIHIHESLKRPIYVAVFGHPSFAVSRFYVNIVARESSEEDLINLQLLDVDDLKNTSTLLEKENSASCPASKEIVESADVEEDNIFAVDSTERSLDTPSAYADQLTNELDEEFENSSNTIDQNTTDNLGSTSSDSVHSNEPQHFLSFLPAPIGLDVLEGVAEVVVEIFISIFF